LEAEDCQFSFDAGFIRENPKLEWLRDKDLSALKENMTYNYRLQPVPRNED